MKDNLLKSTLKLLLFSAVLSCISFAGVAQNLSQHNWYFGNSTNGIRFNRSDNKPTLLTNQAVPFGIGGSAVATDPATADLLFYSDGTKIVDAKHTVMSNGGGLTGNSAGNQPVAICAVPGQTNKYFVFTNSANFTTGGSVTYSVVDMALPGNALFPLPALGGVDPTRKNLAITGLATVSEGMIIVPHSNKKDFWLITANVSSTTYNATLITTSSYTGTFTTTQESGVGNAITVANFSYNTRLKKLLVSPQSSATDIVIVNFDNTGTPNPFSVDSFIANSGIITTGSQAIYDAQWSMGGRYIYFSRVGETGPAADLLQYDYTNKLTTLASVLPAPVFRSYGLQVGPDSAMYYAYQKTSSADPFLVDKFTQLDSAAPLVLRTPTPFGAAINFGGQQFPLFLPKDSIKLSVSFTFDAVPNCQNTPTAFYPTVTPNADSLHWSFGDGSDTTQWSPIHTYSTSGAMPVTLSAFYQGQEHDTTITVNITAFALKLQLVSDTTACECQLPARKSKTGPCTLPDFSVKVKVSGGTATSYVWSNGKDFTDTLHPDSAGYYFVVVKDASGCSAYAGVNVKEFQLQDRRENFWYFGNKAGIDFNKTPAVAVATSEMDAPEGCSVVCDRNGQIIFYTDGDKVWDKTNTVIKTGIGGGTLSAQSALIIPLPGDETLYYIFTTQAIDGSSNNEMRYSLYDLKQNAVVISNQLLFSKSTEHLTGNDNWVIAHENGNNTFRAYPITAKGIGDPVYSSIGTDLSFQVLQNGQGYMKLGGKNNIAVVIATPGVSNIVELFDFVDSTGNVTNVRKIDLGTTAGNVYGVEFSNGGNKLYASVDVPATPSLLYEYSIDSVGAPHRKKINSVAAELGAVQLAPDGQIYVATNSPGNNTSLAMIQPNEDTTMVSNFQLSGFALAGGTNSRLGLPNFKQMISSATGGPEFTFDIPCIKDSTHFMGTSRDPIDQFFWDFGDGSTSSDPKLGNPVHLYKAVGTYTVKMTLTNRCPNSAVTITHDVIIHASPPKPTLPGARTLCNGPLTLDANSNGLPKTTYLWSTGDTTRHLKVTKPIISLSVTNIDEFGCKSKAVGAVGDSRPKVNLGPDQTVCQGTAPAPTLNATNIAATYAWSVPTGVTPSGPATGTQPVDISSSTTIGTPQQYSVIVSVVFDPVTNETCTAGDTVIFTVNPAPTFNFTKIDPTICSTANGSVTITLTGPENVLFSYQLQSAAPTTNGPQAIDQPKGQVITNPVAAGIWTATVVNEVSQCAATHQQTLKDASVSIAAPPLTTCTTIPIHVTNTGVTEPYSYAVVDASSAVVDSQTAKTGATFDTKALPPGNYSIQVTAANGCKATVATSIAPTNPPVDFIVTPDLCPSPRRLVASSTTAGATYTWSGPNIVSTDATSASIDPPTGPAVYTVTGSAPGFCDKVVTVSVTIPVSFTPSIIQTNNCSDAATLTASPAGSNYSYNWFLRNSGGTFDLIGAGPSILVTTLNKTLTYALDVSDGSGCPATRVITDVNVFGDLMVGITATPACDNGKPFTLTAEANLPATFEWFRDNGILSGETNDNISETTAGTYKVRASTTAGCKDSTSVRVQLLPSPVGNLPSAAIICDDPENNDASTKTVALDPGSFVSYDWAKDLHSLGYTDQVLVANAGGKYEVTLMNAAGCTGVDQTIVSVDCEPVINAPTAFRPGSSLSINNHFQIFSFFITDNFQIFIYNRWGELIWTSKEKTFQWDGTMQTTGLPTPSGTYAYVIKYERSYGGKGVEEKHGGVVLLR